MESFIREENKRSKQNSLYTPNLVIACTGYSKGIDFYRIIEDVLLKTMDRYQVDEENIHITTVSKQPIPDRLRYHSRIEEEYGSRYEINKGDIIVYLRTKKDSVDVIVLGGCNNMDWIFPELEFVHVMYNALKPDGCILMAESADPYREINSYPFLSAEMLLSPLNKDNGPVITATFNCYFKYNNALNMYTIRQPEEVGHRLLVLIKDERWNGHYMMQQFKDTVMIKELIKAEDGTKKRKDY